MAGKKNKSKTEKPPAIDKLLMPAVGVVLAFVAYYFMKGINTDIPRVDVEDELALREVFFGEGEGKNHVVLCHTLPAEGSGKKPLPISSVFQDSMDDFQSNNNNVVSFSLMDCTHTLPSGSKIHEKFKLNLKKRPTIFVSGKVGAPKQIPEKHLKTGKMLTKLLKGMLEPHAAKIENTKDFKSKCLNRKTCALLLKGGTPTKALKDAFKNLLNTYEEVQFASIDSQNLMVIGLEDQLPEYKGGHHRFVIFNKVSGGLDSKDGRLITSIAPLEEEISYNNMSNLISNVQKGSVKSKKLSSLPQIKTRSKKLEEQEKAKRDRANKKNEPQTQKKAHSGENDGSKEGRKAERERRRAEHRAKNPDYKELTPEQKAEIERKRRQRMEQESQKWNIEGEDEEPADGDESYAGFEDVDDEGEADDLDDEEDEDEEVMDLD
jgi:hypothetical protein